MPMSVCLFVCVFVCLCVCLCVCLFVCPCFRKISKCNISAISQPIIMKLGIHITYGYTVTDKYFQNFRSKVKVVGRRKVGEYNTYNFCIWHFGLCVIVSKIDRCRSSDPPYEIAINPWWRGGRGLPSLIALFWFVFYIQCLWGKSRRPEYVGIGHSWCIFVVFVIVIL